MKKYFWTLSVMALFAIGFAASDEDETTSNSNSEQELRQKEEEPAKKNAIVGTYKTTDEVGKSVKIDLNEDKRGTIIVQYFDRTVGTYYCSWGEIWDGIIEISVSTDGAHDEAFYIPKHTFKNQYYMLGEWLYGSVKAVEAQDPTARLKLTKIK